MAAAAVTHAWRIEGATAADAPFLREMLLLACNWDGGIRMTDHGLDGDPHLSRYVDGWGRPGDTGVVAVEGPGRKVGAAWARLLRRPGQGYGHVADDIPELSIAVVASARGRGVGRALVHELVARLRAQDHPGVSLSVEDGNGAIDLYRSSGFRPVGRVATSTTMLLDLAPGQTR